MMTKNNIRVLLIVFATLIIAWVLPWLVKLSTNEASRYPFTYFSSVNDEFIQRTKRDGKSVLVNIDGKEYTRAEYDSLLPMLNYRQLLKDDRLPDSLKGCALSGRVIQNNQFYFRYNPREKNTRAIDLHPMFESMSGRVRLENPDDMFSMNKHMVFVDAETNSINKSKSDQFQSALLKRGYSYPTALIAGNPSAKKPYDEGWFALDDKQELYHIKMVNGMPFVKNTKVGEVLKVDYVKTIETNNRRMYALVFTPEGELFYINDLDYKPVKVKIDQYDWNTHQLSILANQFYWNIIVTGSDKRTSYALDNAKLYEVDRLVEYRAKTLWEKIQPYVFPFYIEVKSLQSTFVYPRFHGWSYQVLALNCFWLLLWIVIYRFKRESIRKPPLVYILLTGVFGFISLLLFAEHQQNTEKIIHLK